MRVVGKTCFSLPHLPQNKGSSAYSGAVDGGHYCAMKDGMSESVSRKAVVLERLKYLSAIAFLGTVIPAAVYGFAYLYDFHSSRVFQAIKEQEGLFVSHAMTTSYLFGLAGLVLLTICIFLDKIEKWISGKSVETLFNKIMSWCVQGGVFCLFALVFGAPVFNWFWHNYFKNEGYRICSTGVLPLRTEMFYSVWVRSPQWCDDPEVSWILREEGHGRVGVAEANEYLDEHYVENSDGNGYAPVPPLRRPERTD